MSKLILIPTPIGNLEDITLRALRVLKEVSFVLAEDTRTSHKILSHFGISTPTRSYHIFNEHKQVDRLVKDIEASGQVGLISDAGTPGISDPGFLLVRACLEAGIEVECLPGATALIPALVNSGLPNDRFIFEGFLPHKKGRQKRIMALVGEERTMVFYESPHRIVKTLEQLGAAFGFDRPASVSRELTKLHEEIIRGSLAELLAHFQEHEPRGEFVLVVGGSRLSTAPFD